MSAWHLVYYQTENENCPVKEFLDSLNGREAARVTKDLDLLEEFGTALGAPYVRHLQQKIWELRTRGSVQHRVLYFAASDRRLVLLHAFTKKTQQTPRREIELAERRLIDFQRREKP